MDVVVAVYVQGGDLDPDDVTNTTGVVPTGAWRKGDVVATAAGKASTKRVGNWMWKTAKSDENLSVSEHIARLGERFPNGLEGLKSAVHAIEDAWIDFLVLESGDGGRTECVFSVTPTDMEVLKRIGLPAFFTCSVIPSP